MYGLVPGGAGVALGVRHAALGRVDVGHGEIAAVGTPAAAAGRQFKPVPIGAGSEYQPPARWPLAGAAGFGGLRGGVHEGQRVQLELFANRRVIVVPGGIGVSGGRVTLYGSGMPPRGRSSPAASYTSPVTGCRSATCSRWTARRSAPIRPNCCS